MSTFFGNLPNFNQPELAKYTLAVAVMLTGVAAHHIRRLELCGLCKPVKLESGHRLYSDKDIKLIKEATELKNEGINLPGVKTILKMKNLLED